jgi:hypothetical protein
MTESMRCSVKTKKGIRLCSNPTDTRHYVPTIGRESFWSTSSRRAAEWVEDSTRLALWMGEEEEDIEIREEGVLEWAGSWTGKTGRKGRHYIDRECPSKS